MHREPSGDLLSYGVGGMDSLHCMDPGLFCLLFYLATPFRTRDKSNTSTYSRSHSPQTSKKL